MRYALLLMLCGCAGNQSAFPMPPVFSPMEDAPITVGHPGYVVPQPERSPHKRVLPETPETRREPGVWAGDGPRASLSELGLLDTAYPLPTPDDANVPEVAACARAIDLALLRRADLAKRALAMPKEARWCMGVTLLDQCLKTAESRDAARIRAHIRRAAHDACRSSASDRNAIEGSILAEMFNPHGQEPGEMQ